MRLQGKASAPAKVIISGEHSVVYHKPAIAATINLRAYVEITALESASFGISVIAPQLNEKSNYNYNELEALTITPKNKKLDNIAYSAYVALRYINSVLPKNLFEISVRSEIPISSGLGSSAAVSVATVGACFDLYEVQLNKDTISKIAFEGELIAHGTPSGIDNSTSTVGGYILFKEGRPQPIDRSFEVPLLICNTLVERDTKSLVTAVRERIDAFPDLMNKLLNWMEEITEEIGENIRLKNLIKLGNLFEINQGALESLGVGHPKINLILSEAKKLGSLGGKLTGAGGGGSLLILGKDTNQLDSIASSLQRHNVECFITEVTTVGVKFEK